MIKIGFDYWQTISRAPELYGQLASAILSEGGEVHIITAVGEKRYPTVRQAIEDTQVPYTAVHVVKFKHPKEAPQLKLEKCQELGVEMFFDDRLDTCRHLNKNGIIALHAVRKDNSTYDLEAYPGGPQS